MPTSSLRVTIAEDDAPTAYQLAKDLRTLGHQPLSVARTSTELLQRALHEKPDLIVSDLRIALGDKLPAAEVVYRDRPLPIILASAHHEPDLIARAEEGHAMAYLLKPVELAALKASVGLAVRRFEYCRTLEREVETLRATLEERKLVERAKGILQRMLHMDEEEAYRRLRKYASNRNLKLIEVAHQIITAHEPFRELAID
jgi:two-component system, response regulator PdtaR